MGSGSFAVATCNSQDRYICKPAGKFDLADNGYVIRLGFLYQLLILSDTGGYDPQICIVDLIAMLTQLTCNAQRF